MKNFKGTPGPWQMKSEEVDKPYIRIRGTNLGRRFKIANVLTPVYDGVPEHEVKETRANAKLIEAAPELLKELIRVVNYLNDIAYQNDAQRFIDSANLVIDKALGEA